MGAADRLGKANLFELVVGERRCGGSFPGDVPEFQISEEDIDKIYLGVKKMQRCYHLQPDEYPVKQYYMQSFIDIEDAYLAGDFEKFYAAIKYLMISIDSD